MKHIKLFVIAAMLTAFASASFAGSCCSKKKDSGDKAKTENKEAAPKKEEPKK